MRFFPVIFFALIATSVMAQRSLTLEQCIETALNNNLQVAQAELTLESSESQLRRTKANVMPNLNGFANHNYNWGQRIDPFTNQFANTRVQSNSFGLSSDLTLFSGLQNQQSIKAQQAALESSRFDLETQKNNIALSVSSAFLNVLLTEELIVAMEQQVLITQQQLGRTKRLVEAGSLSIGSQYDLEAQLAQDQSTLIQRRNDYLLAQIQLKQLMLVPADETIALIKPAELEADSAVRLENAATVYDYAQNIMPEVKSAQYSLDSWQRQLKVAEGGRYPTLTLSGSIGTGYSGLRTEIATVTPVTIPVGVTAGGEQVFATSYETTLTDVPFTNQLSDNFNQFVGLSLNVPIFNRLAVSNNVQQARINQDIAELQLEQEKQNLRQRIETARADAVAARELYKSSLQAVRSSEKAFEFSTARFEAGALNATDFNTSKNNLQIAKTQLARSKYDYIFKVKVLDFYMGKPLGF